MQSAQRPDHHGDAGQLALAVPAQQVDSLHVPALEFGLELKHRARLVMPLRDITQRGSQHRDRPGQVQRGRGLALLRLEYGRGPEYRIVGEQVIEQRGIARVDHRMPSAQDSGLPGVLLSGFLNGFLRHN
ncbi:MAG TPA: hypothetical protein VGG16_03385 [Streptosporangiaceae bacterium]